MKYPNILFFRLPQYKYIDDFIEANINLFECTLNITHDINELNKLYDNTYYVLVTFGEDEKTYYPIIEPHICKRINSRWIHYSHLTLENIPQFNQGVNFCYIDNVLKPREDTRPQFSVITTSYLSFHKIQRAYQSLLAQTFADWEWIIMDDSPDDTHFQFLRENISSQQNHKIRLYRRDQNSGSIGNVKNEAVSLARGKYVLELDHDDEITPDCLQNAYDVFCADPQIGFVYMDFYNIYENGENFKYSDFISFGYGGYYSQKHRGKWIYVYITPNINNITASALISLPNHPRIWKRSVLLDCGNYSELLPICDDLEILLRTFADTKVKIAKIHKIGYIQYMNHDNNNFSLIRNREINRLGPLFISPQFYRNYDMHNRFKVIGAYEDETYLYEHVQLWKRPPEPIYKHVYCNKIMNPDYDCQVCILGVDAFHQYIDVLRKYVDDSGINEHRIRYDFILIDNRYSIEECWKLLDELGLDFFKCYVFDRNTSNAEMLLYFHRLYRSCEKYIVLEKKEDLANICENRCVEKIQNNNCRDGEYNDTVNYNCDLVSIPKNVPMQPFFDIATIPLEETLQYRHEIINKYTDQEDHYLEIGVEYGSTFCNVHFIHKTGVDPSPKIDINKREVYQIQKMTSDEFFSHMSHFISIVSQKKKHFVSPNRFVPQVFRKYDVIFIDGMHQVEYVRRDINHSIKYLNSGGKLFIDDILPENEKEQLKVPEEYVVEDGIMKYVHPWTGDVWKVIYYLLKYFRDKFKYKWFHHTNYRGVIMIYDIDAFEIPESSLEIINNYRYLDDYPKYIKMLCVKK